MRIVHEDLAARRATPDEREREAPESPAQPRTPPSELRNLRQAGMHSVVLANGEQPLVNGLPEAEAYNLGETRHTAGLSALPKG